jgi:hypothetical protein
LLSALAVQVTSHMLGLLAGIPMMMSQTAGHSHATVGAQISPPRPLGLFAAQWRQMAHCTDTLVQVDRRVLINHGEANMLPCDDHKQIAGPTRSSS